MSNGSEIVVSTQHAEMRALSKELAASQLLPQALKQKPADVLAIILTGQELGLKPMQAIRAIHIIEGKPSISADGLAALVKNSGASEYLSLVTSNDKIATYKTKRKDEPGETVMSFTIEQAEVAGALGKANWKRFPDAMLRARALAAICRAVYPDVCLGVYESDSGELETNGTLERVPETQAAHVETVKSQLRDVVTPKPKGDVVEGEVVSEVVPTADPPGSVGRALKPSEETLDAKPASTPSQVATTDPVKRQAYWTGRINGAADLAALVAVQADVKNLPANAKLPPAEMATIKALFEQKRAALTAGK
jgi:hypothetical protein